MWKSHYEEDGRNKIGWYCGNFGAVPEALGNPKRINVERQVKSNPAMIIGLCECGRELETWLQSEEKDDDPSLREEAKGFEDPQLRGQTILESRARSTYLTMRGSERSSVLIAARISVAEKLEKVHW